MTRFRGGMELTPGRPARLMPPAGTMPVGPLRLHGLGLPAVDAGQVVHAGQLLAAAADPAVPCSSAPVTGIVRSVEEHEGERFTLELVPDGPTAPTALPRAAPAGNGLEDWLPALRQTGGWAQPRLGAGLVERLAEVRDHRPDALICVGLDLFPPYPDRSSVLASFADDAALGTRMLGRIAGARRVQMASAADRPDTDGLRRTCRRFRVRHVAVDPASPTGDPTQAVLTRPPRRDGQPERVGEPADRAVVLVEPWTAVRLARWVTRRRLDLVQPVLVGWPEPDTGLSARWAFPGQRLSQVLPAVGKAARQPGGRVVIGDPIRGRDAGADPVATEGEPLVSVRAPSPENTAEQSPRLA